MAGYKFGLTCLNESSLIELYNNVNKRLDVIFKNYKFGGQNAKQIKLLFIGGKSYCFYTIDGKFFSKYKGTKSDLT